MPMGKAQTFYCRCSPSSYTRCRAGVVANPFCGCAVVIRGCIFKEIDERSLVFPKFGSHAKKAPRVRCRMFPLLLYFISASLLAPDGINRKFRSGNKHTESRTLVSRCIQLFYVRFLSLRAFYVSSVLNE